MTSAIAYCDVLVGLLANRTLSPTLACCRRRGMLDGMAREPNQFDELFVPLDAEAPAAAGRHRSCRRRDSFRRRRRRRPKACCASAAGCRRSGCSTPIATASFPGRCGTMSRSPGGRPIRGRSSNSTACTFRGGLQRTIRSGKFQRHVRPRFRRRDSRLRHGRRPARTTPG